MFYMYTFKLNNALKGIISSISSRRVLSALSSAEAPRGVGEVGREKNKVRLGRREDGKAGSFSLPPSQRSPYAFVYPLPSLQIAYTAKEHARAPRKREIGLCGGERCYPPEPIQARYTSTYLVL